MKKFLLIVFICLLCFGCGKNNNITVNVYEKDNGEKVEIKKNGENIMETEIHNDVEKVIEDNLNEKDSDDESTLQEVKDKVKGTYNKAKDWYNENKDELKEINKEILEEDKQTVKEVVDKAKNWYNEKTSEDSNSVLGKIKSWYNNNKDTVKDTVKESLNNDKESLNNLFNK